MCREKIAKSLKAAQQSGHGLRAISLVERAHTIRTLPEVINGATFTARDTLHEVEPCCCRQDCHVLCRINHCMLIVGKWHGQHNLLALQLVCMQSHFMYAPSSLLLPLTSAILILGKQVLDKMLLV